MNRCIRCTTVRGPRGGVGGLRASLRMQNATALTTAGMSLGGAMIGPCSKVLTVTRRAVRNCWPTADGPLLRLYYTGGNAVLPRSLWTLPADLMAHLHGWPVPPLTGAVRPAGPGLVRTFSAAP